MIKCALLAVAAAEKKLDGNNVSLSKDAEANQYEKIDTCSLKINTYYRDVQYGNGTRILIKFVRYSITWGQITKLA